jgi:hypothetical protein
MASSFTHRGLIDVMAARRGPVDEADNVPGFLVFVFIFDNMQERIQEVQGEKLQASIDARRTNPNKAEPKQKQGISRKATKDAKSLSLVFKTTRYGFLCEHGVSIRSAYFWLRKCRTVLKAFDFNYKAVMLSTRHSHSG